MADASEFEAVVGASFSQFYLRSKGAQRVRDEFGNSPIAFLGDPGEIMLTSPIQDAQLRVPINIFEGRPPLLDDSWNDVVELSFRAGSASAVTGWDPSDAGLELPLVPDKTYRLRYSVADFDAPVVRHVEIGEHEDPFAGLVRIDVWTSELLPAALMVQRSRGGRYWVVSHGLSRIRTDIYVRRPQTTEVERVTEFADRAFALFPELAATTIESNGEALTSTAAMLADIPKHFVPPQDVRDWSERRAERMAKILVARAQLASAPAG